MRGYNQVRAPGGRGRRSQQAPGFSSYAPPYPPQREQGVGAAGTLRPSPRVTAPRGEGPAPRASSRCAPAGARCGLGIVGGEGPGPRRGRRRRAPAPAPRLHPAGSRSGETESPRGGDLLTWICSETQVAKGTWVF